MRKTIIGALLLLSGCATQRDFDRERYARAKDEQRIMEVVSKVVDFVDKMADNDLSIVKRLSEFSARVATLESSAPSARSPLSAPSLGRMDRLAAASARAADAANRDTEFERHLEESRRKLDEQFFLRGILRK